MKSSYFLRIFVCVCITAHASNAASPGTVVAWGGNGSGQTNTPPGLNGVKAIAAGFYDSVALKLDGTVVAWGDNSYGQTTIPGGLSGGGGHRGRRVSYRGLEE